MTPDSPRYQKAFQRYLRYGISMELQLKAEEHETTHYIWVTQGDDKVRPEHAANEGQIFAWDDPPPTGNPGEEPGCRCIAVPYYEPGDGVIDEPPLEPVYPELALLPLLGIGRGVLGVAARALSGTRSPKSPDNYTDHGAVRVGERNITPSDIDRAMQSARQSGNISTKTGKYGDTSNSLPRL